MSDSIKFYMDEHIPKAVTEGLRRRGVNVLSAQEAGMLGANDYDLLSLANKEGRVIFTKDADFLRLHKAGVFASRYHLLIQTKPGWIYRPGFNDDL